MKKTNIAFSGFMAAILFGSGAANAATAQVASKQYVDNREAAILETVDSTYAKTETVNQIEQNVTNVTEQVTNLGDTINNESTGLSKEVTDLKSTVSGLETSLEGKADASALEGLATKTELTEGLSSKQDSLGFTPEDSANKATSISDVNQSSPSDYPSVGAIVEWTNKKISELSETGLPVNPGNINDNSIAGSKLENGAVSSDKIANDAVTSDKIADDAVTTDKIATGAVGTTEIADEAVTSDKLSADLTATISGKEDKSNKTDTINAMSTSEQYPSASAVYTALEGKADTSTVETVSDRVTALDNAINNEESGLASQIADAVSAAETAQSTADEAMAGLEGKQDVLGFTPENVTNKIQEITAESTSDQYPSAVAVRTALEGKADTTTVEGITENVTNITQQIEQITDPETGLAKDVSDLQSDVSGLQTEVAGKADATALDSLATKTELTEGLNKKQDSLGYTAENTANKRIVVRDSSTATDTDYPSEKAVRTELDKKANKGSTLAEYGITDAYTKNETDTKISEAVTGSIEGDFGPALEGKEDKSNKTSKIDASNKDSTDVYTSAKAVVDYVIPKPDISCQAESNLCVLSVDRDGNISWVNVTAPAE